MPNGAAESQTPSGMKRVPKHTTQPSRSIAALQEFGTQVTAARSQPYYLDVTNPTANKGTVIERLSRYLKIPLEQIATIGDQGKDVLMFKRSGLSIAMGNASEEVQRQAMCVMTSFADEGFANAVEQYILPRAEPARGAAVKDKVPDVGRVHFAAAFGCPVKVINDAAMQALGSYNGGTMLFLGLGTGLGSALMVRGHIVPMELGALSWGKGTIEGYLGVRGLRKLGKKKWRKTVEFVVARFTSALLLDDCVIGGETPRS